MNRIYTISIILCLSLLSIKGARAQQAISTSGGEATGSGGTVSYTVGQIDYITAQGSGGTASQGVQQPYEISIVTGIEETGINLNCAVYPNPATDYIVLSVDKGEFQHMSYSLYTVQSKLIKNEKLTTAQTTISMIGLADAMYLVKVFNNNNEVKSFKIIKNK